MVAIVKLDTQLVAKLHPRRFTHMSPRMAAVVGFLVGEDYTTPQIGSLSVTSDGFVIVYPIVNGMLGHSMFLCSYADLRRNLDRLYIAAELSDDDTRTMRSREALLIERFDS